MTVPHNWQRLFSDFLSPYLKTLDHPKQRTCLSRYIRGLLAPLERKSAEPIAEHVGMPYQRLHHFLNVSPWGTDALDHLLIPRAQLLCGGKKGVLIIDDTALPKSGEHSVGVARQYCGAPRKTRQLLGVGHADPGGWTRLRAARDAIVFAQKLDS